MATRGWESLSADDARKVDLRRAERARGRQVAQRKGAACLQGHHALCQTVGCSCLCHEAEPKPSKMGNARTLYDDIWWDSKAEAEHWMFLKARAQKGEIRKLQHHVKYALLCPSKDRVMCHIVSDYEADYVYEALEHGEWVRHVVDKKGFRTRMYLLKRKWLELQEGITIEEV
jgi:uncharacterized protein DUF1064